MASKITLRLANRSPKQPIKKLPPSIEVPANITIEDIKALIARKTGFSDHNRIGLFDPSTKKTLKNRKAEIGNEQAVVSTGELLVKDLGPQIAWKTVFLFEYFGPILFHLAVVALRPHLYAGAASTPLSRTQQLGLALFVGHFVKREYETLFVHRFSAATMPARNIFKNCFFYWTFSGALCAWEIYAPWSRAAAADGHDTSQLLAAVGTAIYLFGEVSNAVVHLNLAGLRSPGGTERKVPRGYGFSLVTCPNYMFEILSWVGVIIALQSWSTAVFIFFGAAQMYVWAKGKERAYRKEFPDTYKKKRFVLLPGLL
ncbi:hypothetical protein SODALDRAFT_268455 [Sodiomyces alkalinus F11]|uniref:very-long-chain enoyl-CoA reductase n=1 Tax=Sodiomyces alkalinus (strain CBS 110278 / VKM F-3762 / F11) TaxID=1314773 RepID=A0A3N2QAG4_SODAK|nr:hypothetical protein SODALDRAFT_268455 [Sodiomyces alkalinus F11]ROT43741.1 hypothetical protein SODALDRAFT_268455 [Sodiomyces alkalinus F11]